MRRTTKKLTLLSALLISIFITSCFHDVPKDPDTPEEPQFPSQTVYEIKSSELSNLVNTYSGFPGHDSVSILITITDDVEDLSILMESLKELDFLEIFFTLDLSACVSTKEIPDDFLRNNKSIKKIMLPPNITSINNGAFAYAENLEELKIPESVETLGSRIIADTKIKSIEIPGSVKSIYYSFSDASELENVKLNEGTEEIVTFAFANTSITNIEIPSTVTNLTPNSFEGCRKLKSISFAGPARSDFEVLTNGMVKYTREGYQTCVQFYPAGSSAKKFQDDLEGIEAIGSICFSGCDNLEEIIIPEGIKTLNFKSFDLCSNLKRIVLPSTLKEMNDHTVYDCPKLEEIVFNSDVPLDRLKLPLSADSITLASGQAPVKFLVLPEFYENYSNNETIKSMIEQNKITLDIYSQE